MRALTTWLEVAWVLPVLLLSPAAAHAQFSGRLALNSDLRMRGVSQSEGKPAWVLSGTADIESGLYLGALAWVYPLKANVSTWAVQTDVGYAHPIDSKHSWDAGLLSHRSNPKSGDPSYNYVEYFGGMSGKEWATHVYFSPNYFHNSGQSVYLEINVATFAMENVTLAAHAGVLHRIAASPPSARTREDLRISMSYQWPSVTIELALVSTLQQRNACELDDRACSPTAVVSASTDF